MKLWTIICVALLPLLWVSCSSSSSTEEEVIVDPIGLVWEDLTQVDFEDKYYKDIDAWLLFPTFGDSLKMLEGQSVYISGYVLTLEPGRYALSANPFSSCFFCGGAGPESVMALALRDTTAIFYTDEWQTFQGTFRLNDSDVDQLNYILEDAIVREEQED